MLLLDIHAQAKQIVDANPLWNDSFIFFEETLCQQRLQPLAAEAERTQREATARDLRPSSEGKAGKERG